jgi:hypothetical protein
VFEVLDEEEQYQFCRQRSTRSSLVIGTSVISIIKLLITLW